MDEKGEGGGTENQLFPSNVFCLTVPRNFSGDNFGLPEIFVSPKLFCLR